MRYRRMTVSSNGISELMRMILVLVTWGQSNTLVNETESYYEVS